MGEIISIQEQVRPFAFRIRYTDGEERLVSVDMDKRELFSHEPQDEKKSPACPFLRLREPHERICTVHASRPELCRMYLCSRVLILNKEGKKAGRVLYGTRFFTTEDGALLDIWRRYLCDNNQPDDEQWEKTIEIVFTRAGYQVLR
jgi:Fe-S-cluster containining protein